MTDQQHHPFDPEAPKRIAAFLDAFEDPHHSQGAISTLRTEGLRLTVADLRQLLERDAYAEKTRLELAEKCATYRSQRDQARQIIQRVTDQMEAYGHGAVNVRQVLSLLSPTWPDDNYAAPGPDATETTNDLEHDTEIAEYEKWREAEDSAGRGNDAEEG